MKKLIRLALPAAVFAAVVMMTGGSAYATKELSKKEKKPCTTCHPKVGSKDLNDVGKYYKEKQTLVGAPQK